MPAMKLMSAPDDPLELFKQWYAEASGLCPQNFELIDSILFWVNKILRKLVAYIYPPISMHQPNAMVIATASVNGKPSNRVVLLKGVSDEGVMFYTNYNSRKGKEIQANPNLSALFHWGQPERQIRIEGVAVKLDYSESAKYWSGRPRGSQISGYSSPQSNKVESKQWLKDQVKLTEQEFAEKDVPCPDFWGGYIIKPVRVEYWQGQANRFHDRILYEKIDDKWLKSLLAP